MKQPPVQKKVKGEGRHNTLPVKKTMEMREEPKQI